MSLLADLLYKARGARTSPKDVPPGLKTIVGKSGKKGIPAVRILIVSLIMTVSITGGFFFVTLLQERPVQSDRHAVSPIASAPSALTPAGRSSERSSPVTALPSQGIPEQPVIASPSGAAPATAVAPVSKGSGEVHRREPPPPSPRAVEPSSLVAAAPPTAAVSPAPAEERRKPKPAASAGSAPVASLHRRPADAPSTEQTGGKADAYLYAARQHEDEGQYSLALKEYRQALLFRPDDPEILNKVAYLFIRMGKAGSARPYAIRAAERAPGSVPALVNAGISCAEMRQYRDAEEFFRRALVLEPGNREALYNLGLLYEHQQRFKESVGAYQRLVDSGERNASLHLARALERSGERSGAIGVYRDILTLPGTEESVRKQAAGRLNVLQ